MTWRWGEIGEWRGTSGGELRNVEVCCGGSCGLCRFVWRV